MSPTISVIIPLYNSASFLPFALDSVLSQTHPVTEVLVIDDGSTDDVAAVLARYPNIHRVAQENAGAAVARNHGAALASGEFLAFLDADDLWMIDKTKSQLAAFSANPELDAVFGHTEQFAEPGYRVPAQLHVMPAELPSAMLIRKSSFQRLGPYPELRISEAVAWMIRARAQGLRSAILPQVVYRRRLHATNTSQQAAGRSQYLAAVRAALSFAKASASAQGKGE